MAAESPVRLFELHNQQLSAPRAKELLAVVCPGHVAEEPNGAGCSVCPNGDSGSDPGKVVWSLESVIAGHFTAAGAENTVVNMSGCEPHANNFGGTVLLTRAAGKWRKTWYQPGALTESCRKIPLADKREILFCEGSYKGSGTVAQNLYTMDLSKPEAQRYSQLVAVEDTMGACFAGAALRQAFIEKVEFPDLNADGIPDLRVTLQTGTTKKFTEAEIAKLCPDQLPQPTTRRSTVEFLFQGSQFRRHASATSGVTLKKNE